MKHFGFRSIALVILVSCVTGTVHSQEGGGHTLYGDLKVEPLGDTILRRRERPAVLGEGLRGSTEHVPGELVEHDDVGKARPRALSPRLELTGGDALSGWLFAALMGLGLGLSGIAWIAVPVALSWMTIGILLGKAQRDKALQGAKDAQTV